MVCGHRENCCIFYMENNARTEESILNKRELLFRSVEQVEVGVIVTNLIFGP